MSITRKGSSNIVKINSQMIQNNKLEYLTFPSLEEYKEISHLFTTRVGGTSEGDLSTMNMSYSRGDSSENVDNNYKRIAQILNCSFEDFVCTMQTHTTNVIRVDHNHKGSGVAKKILFQDIDGMITNEPGIVLTALFADCVPLYFYDPVNHAIGLSHSGWKGTLNQIGLKTIQRMQEEFHSKPEDIIAAIGPSICSECYEIGSDVADKFIDQFSHTNKDFLVDQKKFIVNLNNGKYHLDLWKINEMILIKAGLLPKNISTTDICTCCNKEYLFSHRASGGKRGNLAALLKLN